MAELLDRDIDYNKRSVQRILYYFIEDTLNRCFENMRIQEIGKYNPNAKWTGVGDLERSLRATITKNANGDKALITFFYKYYGRFVELAVQKELKYTTLPPMESKAPVRRPDGADRLAKPFLHSQIRRKLQHTLSELAKLYTYSGAAAFWQGVDNPNDPVIHSRNEQSLRSLRSELFNN